MSTEKPIKPHLQANADRYRAALAAQIPTHLKLSTPASQLPLNVTQLYRTSGLLTARQIAIVSTVDATALAAAIAARQYTAVEVTEAFVASACIAQQATCCLTWIDPEKSLARARWLDEQMEETGEPVGPLHGVPMSAKDMFFIGGWPQTLGGFMNGAGYVPDVDAHCVKILQDAGAVFIAKTNLPQSVMQLETVNFLGTTVCPYSTNLSAGGSSGGEGALLAMRGSLLGIATDIGGSIRSPSANNGLWGFKPTSQRFTNVGIGASIGGTSRNQVGGPSSTSLIPGTMGPMAHSCRDLELFAQVILAARPWETAPLLMPLPWRHVTPSGELDGMGKWKGANGKPRIGVIRDDGVVRPLKPVRRALDRCVSALQDAGMQMVEMEIGELIDAAETWKLTLYYLDGGQRLRDCLDGEPMQPLTKWLLDQVKPLSGIEAFRLVEAQRALWQRWRDIVRDYNVDVILLPVAPGPAPHPGTARYWSYTSLFNMLDWPAAVFPTGFTVRPIDVEDPDFVPRNETERYVYDEAHMDRSVGAPIGLQLVGERYQDERLMEALNLVDQVLPLPDFI